MTQAEIMKKLTEDAIISVKLEGMEKEIAALTDVYFRLCDIIKELQAEVLDLQHKIATPKN